MFGLFKSKTERVVTHLERVMHAMEAAALMNDLKSLHSLTRNQLQLLAWLNEHGDPSWDDERIEAFIKSKGRVRCFSDPEMHALLSKRVPEAEMKYGLAGAGR